MTEIEPCFYCGSECRVTPFLQSSCFIRCIMSFCYSGKPYDEEKEAIEKHNFIANAVKTLNYINESNWLKTDTALTWKQPMKSIFVRQDKTPTVQYIKLQEPNTSESFSINIEMDSNQYKALKSIIDHEISYLEQKEKEAKEFKVGWVYKDGEGNEILIVSINPRFFPYGVLGFWLSSHWCRFSTYTLEGFSSEVPELESSKSLILSTGKKWGPIE